MSHFKFYEKLCIAFNRISVLHPKMNRKRGIINAEAYIIPNPNSHNLKITPRHQDNSHILYLRFFKKKIKKIPNL
jgi:hypothetical protein